MCVNQSLSRLKAELEEDGLSSLHLDTDEDEEYMDCCSSEEEVDHPCASPPITLMALGEKSKAAIKKAATFMNTGEIHNIYISSHPDPSQLDSETSEYEDSVVGIKTVTDSHSSPPQSDSDSNEINGSIAKIGPSTNKPFSQRQLTGIQSSESSRIGPRAQRSARLFKGQEIGVSRFKVPPARTRSFNATIQK